MAADYQILLKHKIMHVLVGNLIGTDILYQQSLECPISTGKLHFDLDI